MYLSGWAMEELVIAGLFSLSNVLQIKLAWQISYELHQVDFFPVDFGTSTVKDIIETEIKHC